jgi:hypothetical protein
LCAGVWGGKMELVLRPIIRVARPADWTGKVAHIATIVVTILLFIPVALARLPDSWVGLAAGYGIVVRLVLALLVVWLMGWVRAWVFARLPSAPYLSWRTLVFRDRGQRLRISASKVVDVFVELRPPETTQVFMVELSDGTTHELCPIDWSGAGRLYRALDKIVRRQQERGRQDEARSS